MRAWANGVWKWFVLSAALLGAHGNVILAYGQGGQEARFAKSDACIALPTNSKSRRAWKYGDPEQRDFARASTTRDGKTRIESLSDFSTRYPDSDYRDSALAMRLVAEDELGDWTALASDSRKLLRSPTVDTSVLLLTGYNYLADALFHIKADEANETAVREKVDEVDWTVRCGREALPQLKSLQLKNAQTAASSTEFVFAMAEAQASLLDNDQPTALRESKAAVQMKPADARPNYLLALSLVQGPSPQYEQSIFYITRSASLDSSNEQMKKFAQEVYRAYHGSGRGFDKVWDLAAANTSPPANFRIEPEHPKNHNAAKGAMAVVLAALLGYAMVKDPQATVQTLADMGQGGVQNSTRTSARVLLFGGEDHRTFLGCLSCPPGADDSVYTLGGSHGSRGASDSIWNKATFGSPASQISACSPFASDPPVIVEEDGTYLGRLTLNRNHGQIGIGTRYYDWLHDSVCN